MSDEIIVMSKGRIEQRDPPLAVYSKPVNKYVSQFIGVANLLKGKVLSEAESGKGKVDISTSITGLSCDCLLGGEMKKGDEVVVSVRPENISVSRDNTDSSGIEGKVNSAIFLGNCVDCRITSGSYEWKVLTHPRENLNEGDRVFLHLDPEHTLAVTP